MSDELEKKRQSVEAMMKLLADLRFSVSQFQDSIEEFLQSVEESWREIKSSLASIEARLAGMEVRVSTLPLEGDIDVEEMNSMCDEMEVISKDVTRMRQRFQSLAKGIVERVN